MSTATPRKGARSLKDIPADILAQLNIGEIETANLVEWLAIDQLVLLNHILHQQQRAHYFELIQEQVQQLKKPSINSINQSIGQQLMIQAMQYDDLTWLLRLAQHPADTVRCWLCYSIASQPDRSLQEKFCAIQTFAQDHHFGVREVAWMAMRPFIIENLAESLELFKTWVIHADANVRRFATEATRPRGVWCQHIQVLKAHPEQAQHLLDAVSCDPNKYVKDSVGNWLNDASKSQPDFVINLCNIWQQYDNPHTAYIIKRALRSINKNESLQ